jgi:glycosyltransferase involved in cell wall biosynthesis
MAPLVSVIIPTFDRNETLFGRALPSVLAQTHPDVEIHVVSDGMVGPERNELIDRIYAMPEWPDRISLWMNKRQKYPDDPHLRWGLSGLNARNWGIKCARGEFIAALDDDDEMLPDAITTLLAAMTDEIDFVYGISETFKNGRSIGQLYGRYPPGDGALCNGAYVYRSSLPYRFDVNCFKRGLTGDADMWVRMVEGGVRFRFIPQIVHHYHRNYP